MTEKELQVIYDAIMNREVQKANDIIECMYITRTQALETVKKYAKTLSQEELESFNKNYEWFLASYYDYFKETMSLLDEYEKTGTLDFGSYSSTSQTRNNLNNFKKMFPEYKDKIKELLNILHDYDQKLTKYMHTASYFYSGGFHDTDYEEALYLVATSENPVLVFSKLGWSQKRFNQKIGFFRKKYTDTEGIELAQKFENWFNQYVKQQSEKELIANFEERTDKLSLAQSILEDVLASGLSIYEYCHEHLEYNVIDIRKYIKTIYSSKEEADKIINQIESREDSNFVSQLDYIACQIIENPNFTIIDYYLATKLSLEDFYSKVSIKSIEVAQFVGANSIPKYNTYRINDSSFNKNKELMVKRIIAGRYITPEDKEAIFKYLEANKMPVDKFTYRAGLNKLVSSDLDFEQKINVYRGSF